MFCLLVVVASLELQQPMASLLTTPKRWMEERKIEEVNMSRVRYRGNEEELDGRAVVELRSTDEGVTSHAMVTCGACRTSGLENKVKTVKTYRHL